MRVLCCAAKYPGTPAGRSHPRHDATSKRPARGRCITKRDTLRSTRSQRTGGYEDQINLYAYVANDPVNLTDPTGMCVLALPCPVPPPAVTLPTAAEVGGAIGTVARASPVVVFLTVVFTPSPLADGTCDGNPGVCGPAVSENRSRGPDPLPEAEGRPHSTTGDYGGRGYTEFGPNDPVTGRPTGTRQYRPPGSGTDHNGVDRPNVKERPPGRPAPDGAVRPGREVVRPPRENEHRPARPRETQQ